MTKRNTSYPFFLARRVSLAADGRKNSPAIRVAVTAVALSIAVMLAAVAIVLGFRREITDKVTGFNSHISLYALPDQNDETNLITLTPTLRQILDSRPYVTDYTLNASIPAIMKTPDNFKGVYLNNIHGEGMERFLKSNLEEGKIPDYSQPGTETKILISRKTADQLGLKLNDRIDTYFLSTDIRVRRFTVAGIFNSHFESYDNLYIYGPLSLIQNLGGVGAKQGTSISISTDNFNRAPQYTTDLTATLTDALAKGLLYRGYRVDNTLNMEARFFQWLQLLDMNVVVILVLMTIVAAVTLISGLLIIILDKKRFIGILRAMGAQVRDVRKVFVLLAMRVAVRGMLIGNVVMLLLLYVQNRWHILSLNPDAYYIDFVPVELSWSWILILNLATLCVIYLTLLVPARFAARISPAETMRGEE